MTTTNPLFQILPGSGKFSWDPSTGHLVRLDADGYRVVGYAETFDAASAQNYEPSKPRFAILRGLVHNNIFWTPNMEDPTLMATGTVGYEILDYAENSEEAIAKCDKHIANRGLPRHFAGVHEDGRVVTWCNGQTSWTSTPDDKSPWNYCRLPKHGDL